VVSGSVGAGHDGAACELAARLTTAGALVEVRDYLTAVPRPLAYLLGEGYLSTVERIPSAFEFLYTLVQSLPVATVVEPVVAVAFVGAPVRRAPRIQRAEPGRTATGRADAGGGIVVLARSTAQCEQSGSLSPAAALPHPGTPIS
jgi:hypothetical protein